MEKEYGKLTEAQIVEFIGLIPKLLSMLQEMNEHIGSVPIEKFDGQISGGHQLWSTFFGGKIRNLTGDDLSDHCVVERCRRGQRRMVKGCRS